MKFDHSFSVTEGFLIIACAIILILIIIRYIWIGRQLEQSPILSFLKPLLRIAYFALLIFCCLQPYRPLDNEDNEKTQGKYVAKDIYVILDMSLSMDARDVAPSRFAQAKKVIKEFVLEMQGDNLGLIVTPPDILMSEISYDKDYFLNYLDQLDATIQLSSNPRESLELVSRQQISTKSKNDRIVLFVTDGDGVDEKALDWSKHLIKQDIKVFTIGVGTTKGSKIPFARTYKKDSDGNFVHTKLNERALRELSQITEGYYANASDNEQVKRLFSKIQNIEGSEHGEKEVNENKKPLYFPYLLIAIVLILIDFLLPIPLFKLRK